jgi:hypothetical protein
MLRSCLSNKGLLMVVHTVMVLGPTFMDGNAVNAVASCITETWCRGRELQSPVCSGCLQASNGEATLTRCTLRKHASSPASLMDMVRNGAVLLNGPANVTMAHCYVEVGHPMNGWFGCRAQV